jgi:hypothetical protein
VAVGVEQHVVRLDVAVHVAKPVDRVDGLGADFINQFRPEKRFWVKFLNYRTRDKITSKISNYILDLVTPRIRNIQQSHFFLIET